MVHITHGVMEWMKRNTLRWYEHVQRMEDDRMVKRVLGIRARGRARKTWDEMINGDLRAKNLNRETAMNRAAWKAAIR